MSARDDVVLIGESLPMRRLRALIETVAPIKLPVLIEGATGTGKELVAGMLHRLSGRDGSLVAFNVCALGETMFEDALFGHARGAYTGALSESLGFLREANGGTAFLDEISGLALPLQAKLLRAIETGVFRPIGAARDARSDFRAVCATNERLDTLVDEGRFRADLAHRLSGVVLAVPTLDERIDDIPLLATHFAKGARAGAALKVSPAALRVLQDREWPGNVRQLKQVIDTAAIFARDVVDAESINAALANRGGAVVIGSSDTGLAERRELVALLERSDWDTERAAAELEVHRATVYRRMKRLGIDVPFVRRVELADRVAEDKPFAPFALIRANSHPLNANRVNADRRSV